jgi:transposase-like protein
LKKEDYMTKKKMNKEKKLELFAEWLAKPEEERLIKTQKDFARSIGVEEHTLVRWKSQLAETDTEDEIERFKAHVYRQAMKPNATAKHMELYAKLKGLMEKPETGEKTKIDANTLTRAHLAGERLARKHLREEGYGGSYDREEILGILEYAKQQGMIDDYKELPTDSHVWWVFPRDNETILRHIRECKGK